MLNLKAYNLEANALIQWFPIKKDSNLPGPMMRPFWVKHSTEEFEPSGAWVNYILGAKGVETLVGFPGGTDGFAFEVVGRISIGVNEGGLFFVAAVLEIGRATRVQRFVLPPDTRTPFMLNLTPKRPNKETRGTALSLHGVFVTGRTAAQTIMRDMEGPLLSG